MSNTLLAFAIVGGLVTLFTFVAATWKLFRFIFKVDRALPTLLNIAAQFENNGGSTLKDKIDSIAEKAETLGTDLISKAEELSAENRIAVRIAEDGRTIANTNAAIVNELSRVQTEELTHVREYLHDKMHEVMNNITKTNLQAASTEKRSQRIEARLDALLPYVVRHRETDDKGGTGE